MTDQTTNQMTEAEKVLARHARLEWVDAPVAGAETGGYNPRVAASSKFHAYRTADGYSWESDGDHLTDASGQRMRGKDGEDRARCSEIRDEMHEIRKERKEAEWRADMAARKAEAKNPPAPAPMIYGGPDDPNTY